MATGRNEKRDQRGISRFYCEVCGREVPPEKESCPYCETPFYAVKCPRCGHIDKAMSFIYGCPSCGYLSPEQRQEAGRERSAAAASRRSRSTRKGSAGEQLVAPAGEQPERRKRKGGSDTFTTFLLIFLILIIGALMLVYVYV